MIQIKIEITEHNADALGLQVTESRVGDATNTERGVLEFLRPFIQAGTAALRGHCSTATIAHCSTGLLSKETLDASMEAHMRRIKNDR
jgi:hypothetical protein